MSHTHGPWKWVVNPKNHSVELSQGSYGDLVMGFTRWGMDRAEPVFRVRGVMQRASELSEVEPGREHHASWWRVLRHPDADLIAAAPELLAALEGILGIWPHVNCVCGRSKPRIPDAFYDSARAAIRKAKGEP